MPLFAQMKNCHAMSQEIPYLCIVGKVDFTAQVRKLQLIGDANPGALTCFVPQATHFCSSIMLPALKLGLCRLHPGSEAKLLIATLIAVATTLIACLPWRATVLGGTVPIVGRAAAERICT